jgi:hypothetical protein
VIRLPWRCSELTAHSPIHRTVTMSTASLVPRNAKTNSHASIRRSQLSPEGWEFSSISPSRRSGTKPSFSQFVGP